MALSTAEYKARIDRQLQLLGAMDDDVQTDIIEDATRYFVSKMDEPTISADLSVTASTRYYTIPATIRKIVDIRDDSDPKVSKVYSEDTTQGQVVLQDTPSGSATWTVYGSPKEIETNLDTVIAAISEDLGYVLWACIKAFAHDWANSDQFVNRLQAADKYITNERKSRNRRLDWGKTSVKLLDTRGRLVADSDNAEGFTPDMSDWQGTDLNQ